MAGPRTGVRIVDAPRSGHVARRAAAAAGVQVLHALGMTVAPRWLERYRSGERDAVWAELDALGPQVRDHGLAQEAQAVCDEMAFRARRNIETIVGRLLRQGYRFHLNDAAQTAVLPIHGPGVGAPAQLDWLERRFGPVPMTLSSWIRIVGDVWLVGTHPRWPTSSAGDPFVFEVGWDRYAPGMVRTSIEVEFAEWQDSGREDPFTLSVSPDRLHKQNVSGGDPYGVVLPDRRADGTMLAGEAVSMVTCLRSVFAAGGFPHATGDPAQPDVVASLASGLRPL